MIAPLILMLLLSADPRDDATVPVDGDILLRAFVQKTPSPGAMEQLVADEEAKIRAHRIVRLTTYGSKEDLDRTERAKATDVELQDWKRRFSEERRLARPAADFVKLGSRTSLRFFDGRTVTVRHVAGYRDLDHDLCAGCNLHFLYLNVTITRTLQSGVTAYPNVDVFFLYKGGFTEGDARLVIKALGLDPLRHINVVFTPDAANISWTDYPYFNRFINPEFYLIRYNGVGKSVSCSTGAEPQIQCATF